MDYVFVGCPHCDHTVLVWCKDKGPKTIIKRPSAIRRNVRGALCQICDKPFAIHNSTGKASKFNKLELAAIMTPSNKKLIDKAIRKFKVGATHA